MSWKKDSEKFGNIQNSLCSESDRSFLASAWLFFVTFIVDKRGDPRQRLIIDFKVCGMIILFFFTHQTFLTDKGHAQWGSTSMRPSRAIWAVFESGVPSPHLRTCPVGLAEFTVRGGQPCMCNSACKPVSMMVVMTAPSAGGSLSPIPDRQVC